MRQNTKALRLDTASNYQTSIGQIEYFIAQSPEFADLLVKGRTGSSLTESEQLRLWVFYGNILRTYQNMHVQYLGGALDEELWRGFRVRLALVFREDYGLVEHWQTGKDMFNAAFNNEVSEMMAADTPNH